ncbi:MAG: Rrf2 family transcriptional regulator [Desulfobulbaceae bacterium]|nr:Rrf2 family transcriptional regulator [Desulfobulbaceae bacterium]
MKITRAAEYAIRCMVYLVRKGKGTLVSRREIAHQAEIPAQFLAKIAQELARAGFIEIRQGAKGGFVLINEPKEMNLLEIVETIIGEISLNESSALLDFCSDPNQCPVHSVWTDATSQLRDTLQGVTFDKISKKGSCISIEKPKSDK